MSKAFGRIVGVSALAVVIAACGGAESRKARYLEKGETFLADGNYEKARVEFRNALQIDPKDASARYQIGRASEKLGDPREAVGQYQAAIDQDPNHMQARAALARLFVVGGLPDKARELVEPGLTLEPQNAQLLTVRGAARNQGGDVPGAFEDAEAAVQLAPDDEYAIALLASLYRQNARSDKAIEVVRAGIGKRPESVDLRIVLADLELAHERPEEAEAQLKRVIELQPDEVPHRYRLARFFVSQKNVPAAEQTMREAVAAAPDNAQVKIALTDLLATHSGFDKAEAELQAFAAKEDSGAQLQLALGRFYEAYKKPDQAEAVYRSVIEKEGLKPDGLTGRNRLAASLVQQGKIDEATRLLEEVLKENARDNDALVMRGNLALARGDAASAITDLRAVLRDQPNAAPVMRALARAHLHNNETAVAEETLRAAAQANPSDRQVRHELAQLLTQGGRAGQARPVLEQLASERPDDVQALESLFRVQAALNDASGAKATADSIVRMRPDLPLGPYLQGAVDESEKNLDAARAAYERALAIEPAAGEPLTALVRIDLARKQPAQALARLDKAIAAQPDNVIARNLKGELLISRGETARAVQVFEEAIARAPKWWMPYRGLALAHTSVKQNEAAIETLERGLAASGAAALGTDLASLYERLARPDDAIRVYESLAKSDPGSVAVANNLAMLLVTYRTDQTSLDRAQQLMGRLTNVTEPAVLNTRGWVRFKRGEFQESLPLLQQAVEKSPGSPLMRYHLGMAQWRTGDRAGAMENLEAAVKSGQPFNGARNAQATLDQIKRAG